MFRFAVSVVMERHSADGNVRRSSAWIAEMMASVAFDVFEGRA